MLTKLFFLLFLWITLALFIDVCSSLRIQRLTVPKTARANSSEVILDCIYHVDEREKENGFVLQWHINTANLVYQWIPPRRPTILGSLKGRLDPNYGVSSDPWKKYRALRIIHPDPSLSGNYSCTIQTFDGEDSKSAKLLIWAPPADMRLKYWRPSAYLVNITCSALHVSPLPTFKIILINPNGQRHAIGIRGRSDFHGSSAGLYKSHSWGLVNYETTMENSVIRCTVSTKGKMFRETRETVYHGDIPIITTTSTTSTPMPDEEAIKSPSIASLAISSLRLNKAVGTEICHLILIMFLCLKIGNGVLLSLSSSISFRG